MTFHADNNTAAMCYNLLNRVLVSASTPSSRDVLLSRLGLGKNLSCLEIISRDISSIVDEILVKLTFHGISLSVP